MMVVTVSCKDAVRDLVCHHGDADQTLTKSICRADLFRSWFTIQVQWAREDEDVRMDVDGMLNTRHSVDLDVIDLDLTQTVALGCFDLSMAGGACIVHMDRQFIATETGGPQRVDADIQFDGIGPTLSLEGSHPLLES